MALFTAEERYLAAALQRLLNTNPFLPEWVQAERDVLGEAYVDAPEVYSRQASWQADHLHPNVFFVGERIAELVEQSRQRLEAGGVADEELPLYEDLALYHLYREHGDELTAIGQQAWREKKAPAVGDLWDRFRSDHSHYLPVERSFPLGARAERAFAVFFQMRRAFEQIYETILGGSRPAARLRASLWQSLFTHDLHRYARFLCERMSDFPTLITGPSGTGKELAARALGLSQYLPFDPNQKAFAADFERMFCPLNLSALAPTLIESELFGHCKGSFTGAVRDRQGWLELCDPHGAVFLDEVGEVDPAIQVKLLRVLQTRRFERLGECEPRPFRGKLLAATNRDLTEELRSGRFRQDFYYRLCADQITTPTLREQLQDHPADLENLVLFLVREILGEQTTTSASGEATELAGEVVTWIERHLGREYPWPGNVRELGHCVRSMIIRRDYRPLLLETKATGNLVRDLTQRIASGSLTATELRRWYCTLTYARTGSYQAAARHLGLDRRTIKSKVDRTLLEGQQ